MTYQAPDLQPSSAQHLSTPTKTEGQAHSPRYIAAVDLGSNSFHMLLTRYEQGCFVHVARAKQMVQLARGIGADGQLCPEAKARAMACLQDFRRILDQYPNTQVAAAATKVLRMASDSEAFLTQAETQLKAPIALISGEEEALLVYRGMAHHLDNKPSAKPDRRLVIDIGGASTELIVGVGSQAQLYKSLDFGCVTSAESHFQRGKPITQTQFDNCLAATCQRLQSVSDGFNALGWDVCAGASGTLKVIAEILGEPTGDPRITRKALNQLIQQMLDCGELSCELPDNLRHDVLPAGLAILKALFKVFNLQEMQVASASLKEGLLLQTLDQPS